MIKNFKCVNISSKKPKALADFYISIGAPVFIVDWLWEQLKNKVTVIEPIYDTPWGTRKFTIADPDGNELGFCK